MGKIKVSADTMLAILKNIMCEEEINYTITDTSAPIEWQNKKVQDVLNVDYYTFKHRPMDTEVIVRDLLEQSETPSALYSLERAFCILSLTSTERVFSKDKDIVSVSANLEYWLQTDKVKLLEDLIEDMTVETTGIRIPVDIGGNHRQAIIVFSGLDVTEIQEATEFGEMAVCDLNVDIIFYPNVVSKSDYSIEFLVVDEDNTTKWVNLPFSALSLSSDMSQKALPRINDSKNVGNVNLSKVNSFILTFDGYKNDFVAQLIKLSFASNYNADSDNSSTYENNKQFIMKLTRDDKKYYYDCVIKGHLITIQEDTGNEVHSLTLTTRGI